MFTLAPAPYLYLIYTWLILVYFPEVSLMTRMSYENYIYLQNGLYFLSLYYLISTFVYLTVQMHACICCTTTQAEPADPAEPAEPVEQEEPNEQPKEPPKEPTVPMEPKEPAKQEDRSKETAEPEPEPKPKHSEMLQSIVEDQDVLKRFVMANDPNPPPLGMMTIVFDNYLYKDAILRCRTPRGFRLHLMLKHYYGPSSPHTWSMWLRPLSARIYDEENPLKITMAYPTSDANEKPESDSESESESDNVY